MENIKQVLPTGDKEIIKDALNQYQRTLDCLIDKFTREKNEGMVDRLHYTRHDIHSLIGFMEYDVTINMPQSVKENFCRFANVDFPLYNQDKCKLKYPIEEESEWVTIIKGDFSFVDDGVHGRECYVNSIVSITRHLRCDAGDVIDDIENDGGGWIVVEDYDGIIHMDVEDKKEDEKEFLVVDSMVDSVRRQTYTEMKETDGDIMDRIDTLEVGDTGARNDCEVYYIRVK
jgi:hypothetical protein